jgi:glycosyltransferase involved in cell wall biosynthesis
MNKKVLNVLLVDPSLFTAPYDAALTSGLVGSGVSPLWATRPVRDGDRIEIPLQYVDDFFYRKVDSAGKGKVKLLLKSVAHVWGLLKLIKLTWNRKPDVVHVQWTVLPLVDTFAMMAIKITTPVILTVHDTVPFNGEKISIFQRFGFKWPIQIADKVIVHTQSGRRNLIDAGIPADKISVIPHGPLSLPIPIPQRGGSSSDGKWTFVLFGEIKPYKGIDLMVEAVARLPEDLRQKTKVIVAGRPRMDLTSLIERIAELGLQDTVILRPQRQTEEEMALLFGEADSFVFPYRQIDASGVYFLVKALGRWMIASNVGIFAEDMSDGETGTLVPPGDINALSEALADSIKNRVRPKGATVDDAWLEIGGATVALYKQQLQQA